MNRRRRTLSRVDVVTLFPEMFEGPMTRSLLGRAQARGIVRVTIHNLRDFSNDPRHRKIDDRPYGGGAGMVLQAEPIYRALKHLRNGRHAGRRAPKPYVVFLSPQGRRLDQRVAQRLAQAPWLVLLCGHYEGVDERIMRWVDEEISIGDYVLTGGELPAMVLADTVIRLIPGVVKEIDSLENDSFQDGLLDYPHYTRPAVWRGRRVPAILMSGDHAEIHAWRAKQALAATSRKRPDLYRMTARTFS
jgi:tRNA (guanine37-N1)-methyltransferase